MRAAKPTRPAPLALRVLFASIAIAIAIALPALAPARAALLPRTPVRRPPLTSRVILILTTTRTLARPRWPGQADFPVVLLCALPDFHECVTVPILACPTDSSPVTTTCVDLVGGLTFLDDALASARIPQGIVCSFFACAPAPRPSHT